MASGQGSKARIVLQQCLSARLQVQPATEDTEAKYVEVYGNQVSMKFDCRDPSSISDGGAIL